VHRAVVLSRLDFSPFVPFSAIYSLSMDVSSFHRLFSNRFSTVVHVLSTPQCAFGAIEYLLKIELALLLRLCRLACTSGEIPERSIAFFEMRPREAPLISVGLNLMLSVCDCCLFGRIALAWGFTTDLYPSLDLRSRVLLQTL